MFIPNFNHLRYWAWWSGHIIHIRSIFWYFAMREKRAHAVHMVIIFQSAVSYAFDLCTCSFARGCSEGTSGLWLCTVRIQEITLYVGPFASMCMLLWVHCDQVRYRHLPILATTIDAIMRRSSYQSKWLLSSAIIVDCHVGNGKEGNTFFWLKEGKKESHHELS